MLTSFFNHPLALGIGLFLFLTAVVEAGFRLSLVTHLTEDEQRREQITASRDVLGVLLSLLLGFTLAMALPRYDLRRQLVLEEANSIGTAGLRADTLPSPYRENVRRILLQYATARLAYSAAGTSAAELREPLVRTKELQTQLWSQAAAVVQTSPTPVVSLFLQSVNELIDISEKRTAALENRIPVTIWVMLVSISLMTCLLFGLATRRRFWLLTFITPLMIAVVLGLIADLDSPRNGFIKTDLRSLQRAERELK